MNPAVSRLAKFDVVSIEDLETSDIERVFALADGFAAQLERGEQITTAAGLIMGEGAEGIPAVLIRGFGTVAPTSHGRALIRPLEEDLFQ